MSLFEFPFDVLALVLSFLAGDGVSFGILRHVSSKMREILFEEPLNQISRRIKIESLVRHRDILTWVIFTQQRYPRTKIFNLLIPLLNLSVKKDFDFLILVSEIGKCWPDHKSYEIAALHDHNIHLIRWLFQVKKLPITNETIMVAVESGSLEIIKFVIHSDAHNGLSGIFFKAIEIGNFEIASFVFNRLFENSEIRADALQCILSYGIHLERLDIVSWAEQQRVQ